MPMTDKQADARRGTAVWGLNRLRRDLLRSLLADLAKGETEGMDSGQCMRVAKTLAQMADFASALSASESVWTTASHADLAIEFPDTLPASSNHGQITIPADCRII